MTRGDLWRDFEKRSVFGFHGNTESRVAYAEEHEFLREGLPGDWLGSGMYFWLDAPARAWQWADDVVAQEAKNHPGAPREAPMVLIAELEHTDYWIDLIELGPWFDYFAQVAERLEQEGALPEQPSELSASVRHERDDAVIEAATNLLVLDGTMVDAIRCAFIEGEPVCEDSAIYDKAHVQIVVRSRHIIRDYHRIERVGTPQEPR